MTLAKRHRKPRPPAISYEQFWREVTRNGRARCALYGSTSNPCSTFRDAHHYFPKRRIDLQLGGKHKPASIAAKLDTRNGVCLCRYHHELVETGAQVCPRPQFLSFFLVEHGLTERPNSLTSRRDAPTASKRGDPPQ